MPSKYDRQAAGRKLRKSFIVATEGEVTEPEYFEKLKSDYGLLIKLCRKRRADNTPDKVVRRIKEQLPSNPKAEYQAWVVVDVDTWSEGQLGRVCAWSKQDDRNHMAVSNPCFEYWLLLHFEDGTGLKSVKDCLERLGRCMPRYDKHPNMEQINGQMIRLAINRAKCHDQPPCDDVPHYPGTTVYRLVEQLLDAAEKTVG